MSHWNYRFVKQLVGDEVLIALHEVYYDDDGQVNGWTAEPCTIRGDTWLEAAEAVTAAGGAISVPYLDVTTDDWKWIKPGPKGTVLGPAR